MKAYIITLKNNSNAIKSLELCTASAVQWGWNVEPYWAVEGHKLTPADFDRSNLFLNPKTKIYNRPGAQGCFMSHWNLWHLCVTLDEPIIILESDAYIINRLPVIDFSNGLVKLHADKATKISEVTGTWSKGAHAYALTPSHAKQLIQGSIDTEVKPADKAIGTKFVHWRYLDTPIVTLKRNGISTTSWSK